MSTKRSAARLFTIAGTILLSTAASYMPAAQAQGLGSAINQATSLLNTSIGGGKQALPPTNLDSFVTQAGGMADLIYGDESDGLPPFFGFSQEHRINAGIMGVDDAGLTTGHGSYLPDAWGADEFIGNEWSWAGSHNGNYSQQSATALNAADLLESVLISVLDLWDDNPINAAADAAAGAITSAADNGINSGASSAGSGLSSGGGLGTSTGF